jgi:hypothetical protein
MCHIEEEGLIGRFNIEEEGLIGVFHIEEKGLIGSYSKRTRPSLCHLHPPVCHMSYVYKRHICCMYLC